MAGSQEVRGSNPRGSTTAGQQLFTQRTRETSSDQERAGDPGGLNTLLIRQGGVYVASQANAGALSGAPRSLASVAAVDEPRPDPGTRSLAGWFIDRKERHERDRCHARHIRMYVQPPRPAGAKPFFIWVGLCLLGIPIAGYLGNLVAGHVDGVTPALIGGALTGAGIGFAQWLLASAESRRRPWMDRGNERRTRRWLGRRCQVGWLRDDHAPAGDHGRDLGSVRRDRPGDRAARQVLALARVDRRDAACSSARLGRDLLVIDSGQSSSPSSGHQGLWSSRP